MWLGKYVAEDLEALGLGVSVDTCALFYGVERWHQVSNCDKHGQWQRDAVLPGDSLALFSFIFNFFMNRNQCTLLLQIGHPSVSPEIVAVFFLSKMDKMQLFKLAFFHIAVRSRRYPYHQEHILLESVMTVVVCGPVLDCASTVGLSKPVGQFRLFIAFIALWG